MTKKKQLLKEEVAVEREEGLKGVLSEFIGELQGVMKKTQKVAEFDHKRFQDELLQWMTNAFIEGRWWV